MQPLRNVIASHPRRWRSFHYVYPVIARRSRGLSIGINLNPDGACSFNCLYCEVQRGPWRQGAALDLTILETELRDILKTWRHLFAEPEFCTVPPEFRRLNDIAFSGDGEPTTAPSFLEAVRIVVRVRRECGLHDVKVVLITNGSCLTRPAVVEALSLLDESGGEIWAKLDAGTEEYFRSLNRANCTLQQVLDNILATARRRQIVLQSMFVRLRGALPPADEIAAYLERLRWLQAGGARVALVQVYTLARPPAESDVTPLTADELQAIADQVRALGLAAEVFA